METEEREHLGQSPEDLGVAEGDWEGGWHSRKTRRVLFMKPGCVIVCLLIAEDRNPTWISLGTKGN